MNNEEKMTKRGGVVNIHALSKVTACGDLQK